MSRALRALCYGVLRPGLRPTLEGAAIAVEGAVGAVEGVAGALEKARGSTATGIRCRTPCGRRGGSTGRRVGGRCGAGPSVWKFWWEGERCGGVYAWVASTASLRAGGAGGADEWVGGAISPAPPILSVCFPAVCTISLLVRRIDRAHYCVPQ